LELGALSLLLVVVLLRFPLLFFPIGFAFLFFHSLEFVWYFFIIIGGVLITVGALQNARSSQQTIEERTVA
jgi:hypothetical protein